MKIDEDLMRYEQILEMTRPDIVVECGTWMGHSAKWFSEHKVKVITIDIEPGSSAKPYTRWAGVPPELKSQYITYLLGSTTDPSIVERVTSLCTDKKTMVVLDSDHSALHVEQEIKLYGPLVTPGFYLVVEDGILRWLPNEYIGNPLDAIEHVLIDNLDWERDTAIEEMFDVTLYPAGFWRRKL
jgi:cephalosporin hydroxylase